MPEADRSPTPPFSVAKPLALIIVPTRELCVQVFEYGLKFVNGMFIFQSLIRKFYFKEMPIKVCKAYGEYSIGHNIAEIRRGCDILCATPGRLQHLIRENIVCGMWLIKTPNLNTWRSILPNSNSSSLTKLTTCWRMISWTQFTKLWRCLDFHPYQFL